MSTFGYLADVELMAPDELKGEFDQYIKVNCIIGFHGSEKNLPDELGFCSSHKRRTLCILHKNGNSFLVDGENGQKYIGGILLLAEDFTLYNLHESIREANEPTEKLYAMFAAICIVSYYEKGSQFGFSIIDNKRIVKIQNWDKGMPARFVYPDFKKQLVLSEKEKAQAE